MMAAPQLFTAVVPPHYDVHIAHEDKIFVVGSCFADVVGQRFDEAGFLSLSNPFGVLYNPFSVAECIERCVEERLVVAGDLVCRDGLWHSWCHHSRFSAATAEACLERCNLSLHEAHVFLAQSDVLVVTWGTAFVYALVESGRIVGNCHKVPACFFSRRLVAVDEIVDTWTSLLHRLHRFNPALSVIVTVSPIRHLADTAHGNQLSKGTLLLALHRLAEAAAHDDGCPRLCYFPAYEILLDELRDYRYYQRDMVHPSDVAVDVVWDRFRSAFMTADTMRRADEAVRRHKASMHRPIVTG